jgi:hypothetical protein
MNQKSCIDTSAQHSRIFVRVKHTSLLDQGANKTPTSFVTFGHLFLQCLGVAESWL